MKAQAKIDEFAFVLLAGLILIIILMIAWGTPTEAPPFVQPTSISLTIPRNMSSTFDLNITGALSNVTLSATGGIRNWISFSKSNFDVSGSTSVRVKVKVPNVAIGTYEGRINVKSVGGQQSVSVNVLVAEHQVEEFSRSISLGDFSLIYTAGEETLDSKEDIEVSGGYFSTYSKNLVGVLTEKKLGMVEDGYIQLIVDETNNAGNLIVSFNDKDVFNENVGAGEILIPIEKSMIKRSNTVRIGTGMPGWQFWMSTVYRIRSASLVVNYEGIFSKEMEFSLDENEITNFARFHLVYRTKSYSTPLPEMAIKVNNQIVFSQKPPLSFFNSTFERDILGNSLFLSPENTISFSFDTEASYEISGAILNVYYYTTRLD